MISDSAVRMKKILTLAFCSLVIAMAASSAHAQYKWVGPDGKITYSDLPPPAEVKLLKAPYGAAIQVATGDPDSGLPYALKQSATKYPVTLFTAADCSPCKMARELLSKRGIPFSEKSIVSATDIDQFKKLGFAEVTLPTIMVGKEKSAGFESGSYDRLLDAAGYPRTSLLPSTYKAPPAQALTKTGKQIQTTESEAADKSTTTANGEGKVDIQKSKAERARMQSMAKLEQQNPTGLKF
jgi:glutaredoxin